METCDVLVVGGGPAGSVCAGRLKQAGLDVLLLDKETFPRRKPCAGWISPEVFKVLGIDAEEYRQGRVLQDITGFRTGLIQGAPVHTQYGHTVSYGIVRSEFDQYLLQLGNVRHRLGETVKTVDRKDGRWLVNGDVSSRLLVGAGGHFCPVARLLGAHIGAEDVIVAQVAEVTLNPDEVRMCSVLPDTPELFFCRDMRGYGWLLRKENVLNVGLGRMDTVNLARHTEEFLAFLRKERGLPERVTFALQGHSYRLFGGEKRRRCVCDGALLIGDAAGVAHPRSGEGILPAIQSALLAAETIVAAGGDYRNGTLESYPARMDLCFQRGNTHAHSSSGFLRLLGARLLSSRWFVRRVVLDGWFLRTGRLMG